MVEDLAEVALAVLGGQLGARALADAFAGVLAVLELAQLGRCRGRPYWLALRLG